MCGIVGLYNIGDLSDALPRALEALAHRGPDASGIYRFDGAGISVSLGHRRLSIIDLSAAANQPFVKDGLALTYNGEIYNYRELTRELTAAGIKFTTSSDTEVLLEAYRRWGVGCLARLRGMFAFAVLDVRSGKLLLARDHFGIKPLFVLRRGNGAVFASELKAIRAVLGNELNLDPAAIIASLMYYWVPESRCIFRGVTKLPAGSWTEFSPDGGVRSGTFWSPISDLDRPLAAPIDAASLGEIIRASVAAHLVADVPVSCFLSGGLDFEPAGGSGRRSRPQARRVYDFLPLGRSPPGGYARRPSLCEESGGTARYRPQADRDRPRSRFDAASNGRNT